VKHFATNYVFALLADLAQRTAPVVLGIWVSRRLGVEPFGVYFLATSLVFIAGRLSFWGLDQLLTREVAKAPDQTSRFLSNFMAIRLVMALLTLPLLVTVAHGLGYAAQTLRIVLLLSLTIPFNNVSSILQAVYIAREELGYLTLVSALSGLGQIVAGGLALELGWGLEGVALSLVTVSAATLGLNLALVWKHFAYPLQGIELGFWREQLAVALPFVFVSTFYILENRLDVVLLSRLGTEREVGFYGAASTFIGALTLIPFAYRTSILPVMSRLYTRAPKDLIHLYAWSLRVLLGLGLPIAVGTTVLATPLVGLIFGADFAPAGPVLQVLVWSLALLFLNVVNSRVMVVANRQDVLARFLMLSLVVNLILNLGLIPRLGPVGVAVARVASTALFFALSYTFVRRRLLAFHGHPEILRPVLAAALMTAVVLAVPTWPVVARVGLGATVYFAALLVLGGLQRDDWALAQRVFASPSALESEHASRRFS
jgi:O-antigen/teichoic acid export membrane protein